MFFRGLRSTLQNELRGSAVSKARQCENNLRGVHTAHDVPQVGLLYGPATPESGLCVGPQHQILVGGHAGCSVVPCSFLRRGFVIEQKGVWF